MVSLRVGPNALAMGVQPHCLKQGRVERNEVEILLSRTRSQGLLAPGLGARFAAFRL